MRSQPTHFWPSELALLKWVILLIPVLRADDLGNSLCWYNSDRTPERCCQAEEAPQDCWAGYRLTEDFCCHELPAGVQELYERVAGRMEVKAKSLLEAAEDTGNTDLDTFGALYSYMLASPVLLFTFVCEYPAGPALWSEECACCDISDHRCQAQQEDTSFGEAVRLQLCYPVYARRLQEAPDQELEAAIERQLGPGRFHWNYETLARGAATEWPSFGGARGCVIVIRGGSIKTCSEDWACPTFDCSYLRAFLLALTVIQAHKPLPDLDMVLNAADATLSDGLHWGAGDDERLPVFTRTGTRWTHTVALPFEWMLHPAQCQKHIRLVIDAAVRHPWQSREAKLFWRGSPSNCLIEGCNIARASTDDQAMEACGRLPDGSQRQQTWSWSNWLRMPRGRLVWTTRIFPSGVDARFVHGAQRNVEDSLREFLEAEGLFSEHISPQAQVVYKYAIAVDGDSAPDRLYWQLFSGSVVLVPDGPWQVFAVQGLLKPYVHFIPVRYDLSDLVEKVLWLQAHDAEAEQIAANAAKFARRYLTCEAVIYFVDRLLRAYASRLTTEPTA